jgi:hypothetical protein
MWYVLVLCSGVAPCRCYRFAFKTKEAAENAKQFYSNNVTPQSHYASGRIAARSSRSASNTL